MLVNLEAMAVQSILALVAADVCDNDVLGNKWALVSVWLAMMDVRYDHSAWYKSERTQRKLVLGEIHQRAPCSSSE